MMPSIAPATRVNVPTSAARMRRIGHKYLINVEAASTAATTPRVTHAVTLSSTTAQTAIAPNTRRMPGISGTTMPTSPTAITSATRTMPAVLTASNLLALNGSGFLRADPLEVGEASRPHADEAEVFEDVAEFVLAEESGPTVGKDAPERTGRSRGRHHHGDAAAGAQHPGHLGERDFRVGYQLQHGDAGDG